MKPCRSRRNGTCLALVLVLASGAVAASCSSTPTSPTETSGGSAGQASSGGASSGSAGRAGATTGGSVASGGMTAGSGGSLSTAGAGGSGAGSEAGGTGSGGGSAGEGGAAVELPRRANVILVLTDDLSWDVVEHMPTVKLMQQRGVTFSNYFVTDSLCCPSRTSMMTGKYPHNTGVFTNSGDDGGYAAYLAHGNDPQTFAVTMKAAGYRTALLGKFLNGYDPQEAGRAMGWTDWHVAGHGYKEFDYYLNENGKKNYYGKADDEYMTDVLSQIAQGIVTAKDDSPFLIEIATFAPHSPYTPAPRHETLFLDLEYPQTPAYLARPGPAAPAWLKALPALPQEEIDRMRGLYRKRIQSVQAVDEMIATLFEKLKETGQDRDTYVFFASDNGFHMGEHSMRPGKQTAFDTDIHVPLIVVGPGVPAGVTVDEIAQNIDLCSTFAELGDTAPPAKADGRSLVPLMLGRPVPSWRNVALVEHHDSEFDPNDPDADTDVTETPPTYHALRTASTVYVEYVGGDVEYHDLTNDPYELKNTAASLPAAKKQKLHAAIQAIKQCKTTDECWAAQHVDL